MGDAIDAAIDQFRKDGHTRNMSPNQHFAWKKALSEQSQRGKDARAYRDGNKR